MLHKITFIFTALIFLSLSANAEEFVKKSGKKIQGEILDESDTEYIIETDQGILNILKTELKMLDGNSVASAPSASEGRGAVPSLTKKPKYIVHVGNSGLTQFQLSVYQAGKNKAQRHQHLSGLDWGTNDINVRAAIEDEIAFQEALKAGVHQNEPTRKHIIESYRANQTLGDIRPALFQDSEMKKFYAAHKKELVHPAEYKFKALRVRLDGEGPAKAKKAKSNPKSVEGWKATGEMKEGDSFYLPLSTEQINKIYALRQNKVSDVMTSMGVGYVFWCTSYQPSKQKSFDEAKARVKHLMIKSKQSLNNNALEKRVQTPKKTSDAGLFEAAMKAGVHRDRFIRERVISKYLELRGVNLGAIAKEAKSRYTVTLDL